MSETASAPTYDKASWGEGPWLAEPDRVEWTRAGLPCLALRNHHGAWCGYAAVPPGHAQHGKGYDEVAPDVDVHGELTYAGACRGPICHVPKPGEPDNVWWFGFDCGHAGDFMPGMAALLRQIGASDAPPYDHAAAVAAKSFLVDQYRTLDYVREETNRLADQLGGASPKE